MQLRHRAALVTAAIAVVPLAVVLLPSSPAGAHGSLSDPPSRAYLCRFLSGSPENPTTSACRAAVAAGGSQAFYDWHEVSLLNAGGQHRRVIPDGQLCSAGRAKYRGLDLVRADWPAKRISAGNLRVTYHASAPHSNSNFEFYITRQGWSPTQPLRWSDLVHIRTFTNQNPTTFTNWTINVPQRTGRHMIYSIWQRVVGSAEAFYTCSDVDFGGGSAVAPAPDPEPAPDPAPAPGNPAPGGTWADGAAYGIGTEVTFGGTTYRCRQAHTALPGWEPLNTPALWQRL